MSISNDQLLKAIQTIEAQLTLIKQAAGLPAAGAEEGIVGTFDGENMVAEDGRKFPIPPNYASKSMLVQGDTLRMVEDTSGGNQHRFKQIAKVERVKAGGLLTRKDGKFEVICEEGSFKVSNVAVAHFNGQPGDSATVQFARNHTKGSWAAVEKIVSAGTSPTPQTQSQQPGLEAKQPTPQLQQAPGPQSIAHQEPIEQPIIASESQVSPAPQQPAPKPQKASAPQSTPKQSKPKSAPKNSRAKAAPRPSGGTPVKAPTPAVVRPATANPTPPPVKDETVGQIRMDDDDLV